MDLGLFGFLSMLDNYGDRKVAKDYYDWGFVSTVAVNDGKQPFETAVQHPNYNGGDMVIVEAYDTRDEAQAGHARWVQTMTSDSLPETLKDCSNSYIAQLIDELEGVQS